MKSFLLNFLCSIILFSVATKSNSQGCSQWIKSSPGDLGLSPNGKEGDMMVDANDNIYISGTDQYFLTKYDSNGNLVWNKVKAGLSATDLVLSSNNEIFVTGPGALLCKYDANGNELFPAINITNTSPAAICIDNSNSVYIYGSITGSATFGSNTYTAGGFIAKYNSSGQLIWSQNVIEGYNHFAIAIDGNYLYATVSTSTVTVSIGSASYTPTVVAVALIKLSTNGNPIWIKEIDNITNFALGFVVRDISIDSNHKIFGIGTAGSGFGYGFARDTSGVLVSGQITSGNGQHIKIAANNNYSASGFDPFNFNRIISFGNTSISNNSYFGIQYSSSATSSTLLIGLSPTGTMYVALQPSGLAYVDMQTITNTPGNIVIAKFNSDKRLLPSYTSNQSIICGDSALLGPNISGYPPFIQQTNFTGNTYSWSPSTGLSSSTNINPKAAPNTNTNYTVLTNGGACPLTASVSVTNPTAFTYSVNAMVVSFSLTGIGCNSFLWDFGNGNTSSINPNPVITYASAGTYSACLRCNNQAIPCVKCMNIVVPGNSSGGTGISPTLNYETFTISPNPFSHTTTINFGKEQHNVTAKIMDMLGKEIKSIQFSGNQLILEKGDIKEGAYFICIQNEAQVLIGMRKIVIQ